MGKILAIAVLVLPAIIFLALFADDLMTMFNSNSDTATSEADTTLGTATAGPSFGG